MPPRGATAERTYERINTLMNDGASMSDAVRQVAAEDGKKENAVRGNYYNHRRKVEGTNSATKPRARRALTAMLPDEAIRQARQLLEGALGGIDRELEEAQQAVVAAQAH